MGEGMRLYVMLKQLSIVTGAKLCAEISICVSNVIPT